MFVKFGLIIGFLFLTSVVPLFATEDITVLLVMGEVRIKSERGSSWKKVFTGEKLSSTWKIKTGAKSSLRLIMPQGEMRIIPENREKQLSDLLQEKTTLSILHLEEIWVELFQSGLDIGTRGSPSSVGSDSKIVKEENSGRKF